MATTIIKKMPKAIQAPKYISKASQLYQGFPMKCFSKSDGHRYISLFGGLWSPRQNMFQNQARFSSMSYGTTIPIANKVVVASKQRTESRLLHSSAASDDKYLTRKLSSCNPPLMDPRGKVAVVTGAIQGIGLSVVEELLCNGVKVFMIDKSKEMGDCTATRLASMYGWENIKFAAADVTCYESFEACVHLATCHFQRLDILVNNAGVLTTCPREKAIDINYKSVIFGTRLGFKYMGSDQGKNGGIIINVGSVVGLIGLPGAPIYSASKHAVIGATMSYGDCLTYDKTCVRVCAVCPGCTETDMTTSIDGLPLEHFRDGPEERTLLKDSLNSLPKQPARRLGPATLYIIRNGPNGSVWVAEDSEIYQMILPDYHDVECCGTRVKNLE